VLNFARLKQGEYLFLKNNVLVTYAVMPIALGAMSPHLIISLHKSSYYKKC
jgi:hypothetical protein